MPPRLLNGPHRQTLAGAVRGGVRPKPGTSIVRIELGGGDQTTLHVHEPSEVLPDTPTVLLLHGLEGDASRHYMVRTANKFADQGFRTARMNMRCCGDAEGLSATFYHGAQSEDIRSACRWIRDRYPGSPIVLAGFSLGANLMLKAAAESADPDEYSAVVAISPPIDLRSCARILLLKENRFYHKRFIVSLVDRARRFLRRYSIEEDFGLSKEMTLMDFDRRFTVVLGGFRDLDDYYSTASTRSDLGKIPCPWLAIAAQDDPICPYEMFVDLDLNGRGCLVTPPTGGHLGFISRRTPGEPDRRWAENRAVDFVLETLGYSYRF